MCVELKLARIGLAVVVAGGLRVVAGPGGAAAATGHEHCHPASQAPGGAAAQVQAGEATRATYVRSERTYAIPDVTLVDEEDRPVKLREALAADEPVMVNFIFTSCRAICPVMSGIFAKVPRALGPDAAKVRLLSISIDPEQDTPARLRAYADRFGAGPRWSFLTGSLADVVAVERAFDVYRGDMMNHEPLTLLHPGAGRPWIRLDGFASAAELAREYQRVARP